MSGPPFPLQPPGMPDGPSAYNSGSYPAPDQSWGIDIYQTGAQAPASGQGSYNGQQNYPQQLQPANGTQPPNYDAPLQTAAQTSVAPSAAPNTAPPQQPQPSQAQQQDNQGQQPSQAPSTQATPSSSAPQQPQDQSNQARQQCDDLPTSVSVSSVSGVSQDAVNEAASRWSATGNSVTTSGGAGMPVNVVGGSDPDQQGKASFTPSSAGRPAEIRINLSHAGSQDELRALLAHELGHAFGLPDAADPIGSDSLMALTASTPQPSDLTALNQARATCTHGTTGTENAPDNASQILDTAYRKGSWDEIPLRRGWWNENTPDEGFGIDKAGYKHNLRNRKVIIYVIESARTALPASNPDYVLYQKEINPTALDPYTGGQLSFPGVSVSVIVDERIGIPAAERSAGIPADQAVGLITAYCNGMTKCPDWINTLPVVPTS